MHSTVYWSAEISVYGCEGMLANQEKMTGKSKVCMEIESQLILPNWIYSSLSLCKLINLIIKTDKLKETKH